MFKRVGLIGVFLIISIVYGESIKLASIDSEEVSFINNLKSIKKETKDNNISTQYSKAEFNPKDYLSLKDVAKESIDSNITQIKKPSYTPQQYLSLKQIFYPMPDKYAYMYLKMKRLVSPTQKEVKVYINKRRQRMSVYLDNEKMYEFKVSTARRGYWTPRGTFRPYSLERMHYSRKYHNSPMPYSVFFKGGYAIHGTYSISRLGRPASHGCIRVHPKNAKRLYSLIRRYGKRNTKIVIY